MSSTLVITKMKTRLLITLITAVMCTTSVVSANKLHFYPFGFLGASSASDSSSDRDGFVQVLACSNTPETTIRILPPPAPYKEMSQTIGLINVFNKTMDFSQLPSVNQLTGRKFALDGLQISSYADVQVYGVKSQLGAADGFLVPKLTDASTDFYIAGWKDSIRSSLLVAASFPGTLVDVYKPHIDGELQLIHSAALTTTNAVREILLDQHTDTTGLFVNSSKPINVFAGAADGLVPLAVGYSDYMVAEIPPVKELGRTYVVPPIYGRSPGSNYLVRVVATQPDTQVEWRLADGSSNQVTPRSLAVGQFQQIEASDAAQPLLVTCSKPCLVMQYNKGFRRPNEEKPTYPFMMLTTPVDHFVDATCFPTANGYAYSASQQQLSRITDFVNYISVVTEKSSTQSVLLDGKPITFGWQMIGDYAVAGGQILHGWHSLSVRDGSGATFSSYVYGHSADRYTNPSAYGYSTAYRMHGSPPDLVAVAEPVSSSGFHYGARTMLYVFLSGFLAFFVHICIK